MTHGVEKLLIIITVSAFFDSLFCIRAMSGIANKYVGILLPILAIASCMFLVQPCECSQVEERHLSLQSSVPQSIQSLREDISNPVPYHRCTSFAELPTIAIMINAALLLLAVCQVGVRQEVRSGQERAREEDAP